MKYQITQMIKSIDWNQLVQKTYERPYNVQQQNGVMMPCSIHLSIPAQANDFTNDAVPEIVNHQKRGVNFKAWLARDPKTPLNEQLGDGNMLNPDEEFEFQWRLKLWWERNFYPDLQILANDLNNRGLLEPGEYSIIIDW